MAKCEDLLEKAKASSANITYSELTKLAECYGWHFRRNTGGSHVIYFNPNADRYKTLTFVRQKGKVPSYQVANLLAAIELLEK